MFIIFVICIFIQQIYCSTDGINEKLLYGTISTIKNQTINDVTIDVYNMMNQWMYDINTNDKGIFVLSQDNFDILLHINDKNSNSSMQYNYCYESKIISIKHISFFQVTQQLSDIKLDIIRNICYIISPNIISTKWYIFLMLDYWYIMLIILSISYYYYMIQKHKKKLYKFVLEMNNDLKLLSSERKYINTLNYDEAEQLCSIYKTTNMNTPCWTIGTYVDIKDKK